MTDETHPRPDGVRVTYRRMKFGFEDGFDRYWNGGSAFRSLFWTQLSTAFQPGERFFIDSARALRGEVDDPDLLDEFEHFCRQEGHHTAQHLKFDAVNEAMGVDVLTCRRRYTRLLDLARSQFGPKRMLGITCALEHFTSGLADQLFARPEMSEGADPKVIALWRWHAIEEAEHRGTCFDVYRSARGGYALRVHTLVSSWIFIVLVSLRNTLMLLRKDGRLFTWDTLMGFVYLFGPRGVLTALVPDFLRYLSPRFHPWSAPTTIGPQTIQRWQRDNSAFIVNLDQVEARFA